MTELIAELSTGPSLYNNNATEKHAANGGKPVCSAIEWSVKRITESTELPSLNKKKAFETAKNEHAANHTAQKSNIVDMAKCCVRHAAAQIHPRNAEHAWTARQSHDGLDVFPREPHLLQCDKVRAGREAAHETHTRATRGLVVDNSFDCVRSLYDGRTIRYPRNTDAHAHDTCKITNNQETDHCYETE